ncbi:20680_t:CDS:2 [Entrophospora sp. SA101]|nr:20680_t:CDS:2 [Entrophospora sp. SA101]
MTGDGLIIDQSLTMQNSPAAFYYGYPSSPTPPPSNPQNQPPYNPYKSAIECNYKDVFTNQEESLSQELTFPNSTYADFMNLVGIIPIFIDLFK